MGLESNKSRGLHLKFIVTLTASYLLMCYFTLCKSAISSEKNSMIVHEKADYLLPSKMHKEVRNDPEVQGKL